MIEVKRKSNESTESMLRRFADLLKEDRKLEKAREVRFWQKPKSKKRFKKEALLRKIYQEKRRYFKKIGLIK